MPVKLTGYNREGVVISTLVTEIGSLAEVPALMAMFRKGVGSTLVRIVVDVAL